MADRRFPAFRRLHGIGGAEDQQVRDGAQRGQVFDRLVRRPVAADADAAMGEGEQDRQAHHRRHAEGRPLVVREDQIGHAGGHHAAMRGDAVQHRSHRMLAHAVMQVAARAVLGGEGVEPAFVLRRRLQVRRAGEHLGHRRGGEIDQLAAGLPARLGQALRRGAAGIGAQPVLPAFRQAGGGPALGGPRPLPAVHRPLRHRALCRADRGRSDPGGGARDLWHR